MQKCSYCGADLSEDSRFCGACGNVQDAISTEAVATRSTTPQPQSWMPEDGTLAATLLSDSNYPTQDGAPAWSPNVQAPETPPPLVENEDEDERRGDIPLWSPLYGATLAGDALLGSGQVSTSGVPLVQGTPQMGSVPGIAGSPLSSTNAPASPPAQMGGNAAPASQPAPGPGNAAPVSHPVQVPAKPPVTHPVHKPVKPPASHPVKLPVSHPVPKPQPVDPPEPPGTEKHHPPHRHHDHPTQHTHHRAARVTKVAGASSVKTIIIVVTVVAVVAAGGIAAAVHFLSHSQPLISISSQYKVGNAPAGANGTVLHINGQNFSSNSAITFLLDGAVAPGNSGTRSDSNGNFSTDMTITSAWSAGTHTLTARDGSNDSTKNSVSVTVVQPGQANTPGPNGAPPDDASFKVIAHIQRQPTSGNPYRTQENVIITGHPDPMGGTVCQSEDNGQPVVITGFTSNPSIPWQETATLSCTGSYKGGQFTLTERYISDAIVYSEPDGTMVTCTLISSQHVVDEQLSGSYTGNNTFSGTITYPAMPGSDYSCDHSYTLNDSSVQSYNWTGQVTDLHS